MGETRGQAVERAHRLGRAAMELGVETADRAWARAEGDPARAGEELDDLVVVAAAFARSEMERRAAGGPRATAEQLDEVERRARAAFADEEVAG